MLEKPAIKDQAIIDQLQDAYDITITGLAFLPIGWDEDSALFRVEGEAAEAGTDAADTAAYFLKLRRNFDPTIVEVPQFLQSIGMPSIITPIATRTGGLWSQLGEYAMILFPFIEGQNAYEVPMTGQNWREVGAALKKMHTAHLPPELAQRVASETWSPRWRDTVKHYQAQVERAGYHEPTAAEMADFIREHQAVIDRLVERAGRLALALQEDSLDYVLCHADLHGGNLHLTPGGDVYIVDWDTLLLAPKERDLMFVGGGNGNILNTSREELAFYQGYGPVEINYQALAYYRCERIVEDLAVYCEQLLGSEEGGENRRQSYEYFVSNFLPGREIEIAMKTGLD